MPVTKKIAKILTDYCENTSLVGLSYISNRKIHLIERLFWLICIIISSGGSYYLIREYQQAFDSNSISLVMEGTRPQDKTHFPSIAVCELYAQNYGNLPLQEYLKGLYEKKGRTDYNTDIEDYLTRIAFPNAYYHHSLEFVCSELIDCADCFECPYSGYKEMAKLVRMNCTQFMTFCSWNGKPFDCCNYFLPLQTPNGLCFMMNSIQTTTRNSPHWMKTDFGWDTGKAELELHTTNPVQLFIQNSEDVPNALLKGFSIDSLILGAENYVQLRMQNTINDPGVRDVPPEYRKCRFPDEQFENSTFDSYSFTTCALDCIKQLQIKRCGCTDYNYLVKSNDKSPSCDYEGFVCLDQNNLIRPVSSILQPWQPNSLDCLCLPSCTDHEIHVFEHSIRIVGNEQCKFTITQSTSTEQYRRQVVRTRLDAVVTIGGILGLFMGASILSGIEILYFFLVRIFNIRN